MKPFVVIFDGSVGSSWYCDVLKRYPSIYIPAFEPLNKDKGMDDGEKLEWIRTCFSGPEAGDIEGWVNRLSLDGQLKINDDIKKIQKATWVGFKMRLNEVDRKELRKILAEMDVKVILLNRNNKLKQALSDYRRRKEQKSHFKKNADNASQPSQVEPDVLKRAIDQYIKKGQDAYEYVKKLPLDVLYLSYEDLMNDYENSIRASLDFLGLKKTKIIEETAFSKSTSDNLEHALVNYAEIKDYFKGSPYEQFFWF